MSNNIPVKYSFSFILQCNCFPIYGYYCHRNNNITLLLLSLYSNLLGFQIHRCECNVWLRHYITTKNSIESPFKPQVQVNSPAFFFKFAHWTCVGDLNFELSKCTTLMNLTLKCTKFSYGGACPQTPLEGPRSTHHSLTKSCGKHCTNIKEFQGDWLKKKKVFQVTDSIASIHVTTQTDLQLTTAL